MTFAREMERRTGPVMIDELSFYLDQSTPPRASFAEHLDADLNPQPLDRMFEGDKMKRTGPALQ